MTDKPHTYNIAFNLAGSQAMYQNVLSNGRIMRDTGKARLIRGMDTANRIVEVWLPNFWITQELKYKHSTTYLLKYMRELDLEFKIL